MKQYMAQKWASVDSIRKCRTQVKKEQLMHQISLHTCASNFENLQDASLLVKCRISAVIELTYALLK